MRWEVPCSWILMNDIVDHPFSGIVERYRRLHMSRRMGNTIKEKCIKHDLFEAITVPTQTGKVVLLQLTDLGKRIMRNKGYQINQSKKREGLVHEYWKKKAAEHYESLGYKVSTEEPVNGYTDLVIEKNGKRFAVEIETGKSNWRINVNKNIKHGFSCIILIATNDKTFQKLRRLIEEKKSDSYIKVCRAQDFL